MKDFFSRNGVSILANLITVIVLLVSLAVAWGQISSAVEYNTNEIKTNRAEIIILRLDAVTNKVQYAEIQKDIQYIKQILIEMKNAK